MRRIFSSIPGRCFCHFVAFTVALPSFALALATRAPAQLVTHDLWAVMPFVDDHGGKLGPVAAEAFQTELSKQSDNFSKPIDVASMDSVTRAIETLNMTSPVTETTSLLRVGQELRATVLVTGHVVNSRVITSGSSKEAEVILRAEAVNVASGVAINGAVLDAKSGVLSSSVSDADAMEQALDQAASKAISQIVVQTLPTGTVLNTFNNDILVNQGTRSGFKEGEKVIITRGSEQVASGTVRSVEPDESNISITNTIKGVQPGDIVQVIFAVPDVSANWGPNGSVKIIKPPHHGNNETLVSILLVVGLLALLLGGGNGSSTSVVTGVVARPDSNVTDPPASPTNPSVMISWSPNGFAGGNQNRVFWEIWRSDYLTSPVAIVSGEQTTAMDSKTSAYGGQAYYLSSSFMPLSSGTCNGLSSSGSIAAPALQSGTPYTYGVQLVFALQQGDLPTASNGSSGGTGGGTIGGSTGTIGGSTGTIGGSTGTIGGGLSGGGFGGGISGGGGFGAVVGATSGNTTGGAIGKATATAGGATAGGNGTTGATTGATGATTGATGTTGTTATTTGTTAGTTGTTSGTSSSLCYFMSTISYSKNATPLTPAGLVSPADSAQYSTPIPFSFTSVVGAVPIQVQYVLEVSADPTFAKADTYAFPPMAPTGQTGTLSTATENLNGGGVPSFIKNATTLYWRIGAKNIADSPGPVADALGLNYVFSPPRVITKAPAPPGAP